MGARWYPAPRAFRDYVTISTPKKYLMKCRRTKLLKQSQNQSGGDYHKIKCDSSLLHYRESRYQSSSWSSSCRFGTIQPESVARTSLRSKRALVVALARLPDDVISEACGRPTPAARATATSSIALVLLRAEPRNKKGPLRFGGSITRCRGHHRWV